MPATWAAAEMVLNFAVEGHVTAVTFPDGSAGSSSALYLPSFRELLTLCTDEDTLEKGPYQNQTGCVTRHSGQIRCQ
jgi:hypothetical protein